MRRHKLRQRYGRAAIPRLTRAEFEAEVEQLLAQKFGAERARRLMSDWGAGIYTSYGVRRPASHVVRDIIKYDGGA